MKILLIDDDADIRTLARLSLSRLAGFDVVEAANGAEGVALAAAEQPDAIILDVMMPGMNGPETLAALRAQPSTVAIPVFFLTAKAMTTEIDRLRALGVAGILTKPFDPLSFPDQVREGLARWP